LTPEQQAFVADFNPDSLFGEDAATGLFANETAAEGAAPAPATSSTVAEQAPATFSSAAALVPEPAWQFILIKLAPKVNATRFIANLQAFGKGMEQDDRVQDWIAGAGTVARTAVTIRFVFYLMVTIVAVVVIMITMNVLVVSISERVPEIGTLRALGARKRFIRRMILLETSFLAVIAGLAGLVLGLAILLVLRKSGIQAPNLFFEAIFAGRKLVPVISPMAGVNAFLWIFATSILSSLYPIALALRIKPVVAMQGE
jgi:putative ABC transport system permease protein